MKPLRNNRHSGGKHFVSLCFLIVSIVLMVVLLRGSVEVDHTYGISAEPTIHSGQWVLMDTWSYHFHAPQRGDMVILEAPPTALALIHMSKAFFVKRIIGLPGDSITINNTQVIVNGIVLNEPYVVLQGNPNTQKYEQVKVPPHEYWVMGDDRLWSGDSREFGFVPRQNIIGRVVAVLWPFAANSGYLPDESSVFQGV